jgi:hypothetical protein
MAKKNQSKRAKLVTMPTQTTIALSAGEASQTTGVVHVSSLLSQMNSRLYRQAMNYDVQFALTEPTLSDVTYQINFYTLPNTWFTHGAIKHAFNNWRASIQGELTHQGGEHSRWLDFTIRPDADGSPNSNVFYPNFWDGNSHTAVSTGYKTDQTTITDAAGNSMFFQAGGTEDKSGSGNYNIFLEYARHLLSRRADSTSESGPQSYEGIQAGLDDLDEIMEVGDVPPYDQDFEMWHGASDADSDTRLTWVDTLYVGKGVDSDDTTSRASGSRLVTRTITAPLGLVFVEATAQFSQSSDSEFALVAKSGSYKGVSATPIVHHDLLGATAKSLK